METNNISIGSALACLNNDNTKQDQNITFPGNNNNPIYENIRQRYSELSHSPTGRRDILDSVPHYCCPSSKAFLEGNDDFFIAYYISSEKFLINITTEHNLVKHLNDCYWCFKCYNQFIRDYHFNIKRIRKGEEE